MMHHISKVIKRLAESLVARKNKVFDTVRLRILRRGTRRGLKIIVGSASTRQAGWISTNYPDLDLTDIDTFKRLFGSTEVVSHFLAEHVWEHLPVECAAVAAMNCHLFLKRGGVLRIAVPDGMHTDVDYIDQVKPGGYGPGADDHKYLYDYKSLSKLLVDAGFQVELLEWFDERGQFNAREWDIADGMVYRSQRFDERNAVVPTKYTSLIVDARKI